MATPIDQAETKGAECTGFDTDFPSLKTWMLHQGWYAHVIYININICLSIIFIIFLTFQLTSDMNFRIKNHFYEKSSPLIRLKKNHQLHHDSFRSNDGPRVSPRVSRTQVVLALLHPQSTAFPDQDQPTEAAGVIHHGYGGQIIWKTMAGTPTWNRYMILTYTSYTHIWWENVGDSPPKSPFEWAIYEVTHERV